MSHGFFACVSAVRGRCVFPPLPNHFDDGIGASGSTELSLRDHLSRELRDGLQTDSHVIHHAA
jgi:hypothetical protein